MNNFIPWFTINNYTPLMNNVFDGNETGTTTQWFSVRELLAVLQSPFSTTYKNLDARDLSQFLQNTPPVGTTYFNGSMISTKNLLIAMKLLCPTLRCCDYFLWNEGAGTHTGIDIILPQQTPLISFTDGEVIRIKIWDGVANNEGNCVVVKAPDGYVVGYEHLERIDVVVGQKVTQGEQIGTCGSTGNSTQFHLHVQVDKGFAPFHPYWSANLNYIKKYTIDPLPYLRAQSPLPLYLDLPQETKYIDAIKTLTKNLIIKGFNRHILPENTLKRYEAALMIDRTLRLYSLYNNRPVIVPIPVPYHDIDGSDPELIETLNQLQKYGIMKGYGGNFHPNKELKGEELLALLGRIFYGLTDTTTNDRWQNYVTAFIQKNIIDANWGYIGKNIPRKEVFLLLAVLLEKEGVISSY